MVCQATAIHPAHPTGCAHPADRTSRRWLRTWAGQNPRKGHRRAWAALRAEGMVINRKKI